MDRTLLMPFLGALLCLFSAIAHAEYQFKISAGYAETDSGDLPYSRTKLGSATFFLTPVRADGKPWRLAPFVDQSSTVSLRWLETEFDRPIGHQPQAAGLFADVSVGETPLRVGLGYDRKKGGPQTWLNDDNAGYDEISASLGWYLLDYGLLSFTRTQASSGNERFGVEDYEKTEQELTYRQAFSTQAGWLDFSVSASRKDLENYLVSFSGASDLEVKRYGFDVMYYPIQQWGIGLLVGQQRERVNGEGQTIESTDVGLQLSFDPFENLSVSLFLIDQDLEPDFLPAGPGSNLFIPIISVPDRETIGGQIDIRF